MRPDRIVCNAEQARELDAHAQRVLGIGSLQLMEAAGLGAVMVIKQHHPIGTPVLVLAGPGNNGGDGLVVARILSQIGYPVHLHALGPLHKEQSSYLKSLDSITYCTSISDWPDSGIVVDALFGIGLGRGLDGDAGMMIEAANMSGRAIWSLDIPSGLDATNGTVAGAAIRATHTVAMGCYKSGYYSGEGPDRCGSVHLIPLGFPADKCAESRLDVMFASDDSPLKRQDGRHKYENGVVHVIGGSSGMSGAVVMAANAAWRSGCGAVMVHVPMGLLPRIDAHLIQQVKIGHGSPTDTRFLPSHAESVLERIAQKPGVILIGPGMGQDAGTNEFVREIAKGTSDLLVVDADALGAMNDSTRGNLVQTPHPGELAGLAGGDVTDWTRRLDAGRRLASRMDSIVVSKGQPTVVIRPDGCATLTGYDTRLFSRMGYGDVLAGTIAAFCSFESDRIMAIRHALLAGYRQAMQTQDPYNPI